MARPLRVHFPGVLCHVVSRGNNKQTIFTDARDYLHYTALLTAGVARFHVGCVAYCLMSTHVHLVLRPQEFPVSRLMQQVNSSYCRWWNSRHGRVGHVLQGRFKLRLVDDEIYRHRVVRYVTRNPLTAGCVERLEDWRWSSYRAMAGLEPVPALLDPRDVWSMFPPSAGASPQQQFREFVLQDVDDVFTAPTLIAGTPGFVAALEPALRVHVANPDFVYADRFAARPSVSDLFDERGMPLEAAARRAFHEYGYSLGELSRHLHTPPSTIWRWVRRGVRSRSSQNEKIEI